MAHACADRPWATHINRVDSRVMGILFALGEGLLRPDAATHAKHILQVAKRNKGGLRSVTLYLLQDFDGHLKIENKIWHISRANLKTV